MFIIMLPIELKIIGNDPYDLLDLFYDKWHILWYILRPITPFSNLFIEMMRDWNLS